MEIINCECGTSVAKRSLNRHLNSQKHKAFDKPRHLNKLMKKQSNMMKKSLNPNLKILNQILKMKLTVKSKAKMKQLKNLIMLQTKKKWKKSNQP